MTILMPGHKSLRGMCTYALRRHVTGDNDVFLKQKSTTEGNEATSRYRRRPGNNFTVHHTDHPFSTGVVEVSI